jgi:hypothetical protein
MIKRAFIVIAGCFIAFYVYKTLVIHFEKEKINAEIIKLEKSLVEVSELLTEKCKAILYSDKVGLEYLKCKKPELDMASEIGESVRRYKNLGEEEKWMFVNIFVTPLILLLIYLATRWVMLGKYDR